MGKIKTVGDACMAVAGASQSNERHAQAALTVNLASRMESSGVPGRIQVADSTRALLPDQQFESREVDVKGLGHTTTSLLR